MSPIFNRASASATSNGKKPLASISMDLDNQWSYMKTHGDPGWENFPSYFDRLIPHVLGLLDQWGLKITFFIVGQDAALEKNKETLKLLTEKGHEVGNHSFHHEPWLHLYTKDQIRREILETEKHILRLAGQKPLGFRGPGFSWSVDLFDLLLESGYIYDSTTLPTFLGPLARAYYFRKPNLSKAEKNKRNEILGGFREGMRPVKAYYWKLSSKDKLLEIPVTTIPIVKTPFHMSYLLFLSRFSVSIMLFYLKLALTMCRLTQTEPSFVIHPTDLLSGQQVPAMRFFPGMGLSAERKLQLFSRVITVLSTNFNLVPMRIHANAILKRNDLKTIQP